MICFWHSTKWAQRAYGALLGASLSLAACSAQPSSLNIPEPPSGAVTNASLPVSVADLPAAAALRTARRFALVIGNSDYRTGGWQPLRLPGQDANAMARALTLRGFTLIGGEAQDNVSAQRMRQLVDDTVQAAGANPGAIVVVYFAGHGFTAQGQNYLVPVGAPERSQAIQASANVIGIAQRLHAAGSGLVAMFLDACRDDPDGGGGLTNEATPDNTLIGFAAQYGTTASEPATGTHGYYTAALLESMDSGFARLEDMHLAVSEKVSFATGFKQTPVFRPGDRMPEAPVRLALSDPQTAFALALRRKKEDASLEATRCAAQSDFRLLLNAPEFSAMFADRGLLIGPQYEPIDLAAIGRSCTAAYAGGSRTPAVLRALAIMRRIQPSLAQTSPQGGGTANEWSMLTQAAEEGDAESNYLLGSMATAPGSIQPLHTAKDRLLAAAGRNEAPITGLVSLMLGDDRSGADFRHQALLPDDKPLGDRLFRTAVMDGDPLMVGWAFILKRRNASSISGLPLREAFNRALLRGGDLGFYVPGTTVYESLFLLAIMNALNDQDWPEYARLMVQAVSFLDRDLAAFASASGIRSPNPAHLITIAACAFENGLDPFGNPLPGFSPNRTASMVLFRYAAATGDSTAKIILAQEEIGHLSCKGSKNAD